MAFVGEKYILLINKEEHGRATRQQWRGKEKRNFRVTNPKSERRKKAAGEQGGGRKSSRPTDGQKDA